MLIVDAYNVLHVAMPPGLAGLDEAGLCMAIARSGAFARQPAVVVCDGRPKPLGAQASPVETVELVYSGAARTADAVIIERVVRDPAPKRITVVTNDREIRAAVRRRRARLMHSEAFVIALARSLGQQPMPPGSSKPSSDDLTDDEVDRWLSRFGFNAPPREAPRTLDDWIDEELDDIWPPKD